MCTFNRQPHTAVFLEYGKQVSSQLSCWGDVDLGEGWMELAKTSLHWELLAASVYIRPPSPDLPLPTHRGGPAPASC